eukprot:TRINITY_DN163435_c0_g1_i1.p1 TRINITY_DN163435_c0_g1~~TRINITY_DN163435_c0_g1_i1.p1  ORF type:complete len:961 (+),score=102.51 TRINITY_DN163435_c0_g1_i1:16324-19206(+)
MRIKKNKITPDSESLFYDGNGDISNPSGYQLDCRVVVNKDFDISLMVNEQGGGMGGPSVNGISLNYFPFDYSEAWTFGVNQYGVKVPQPFWIGSEQYPDLIKKYGDTMNIVVYAALCDPDSVKPFKTLLCGDLKNWKQISIEGDVIYVPVYIARIKFDVKACQVIESKCKVFKLWKKNLASFEDLIRPTADKILPINLVYPDISTRDMEKAFGIIKDGQVVKVTDASGDPNIEGGWAIYKYYTRTDKFYLLEKENSQQSIPSDRRTIEVDNEGKLAALDYGPSFDAGMSILEDFDFDLNLFASGKRGFHFSPQNGRRWIKVQTQEGMKYIGIVDLLLTDNWSDNIESYCYLSVVASVRSSIGTQAPAYTLSVGMHYDEIPTMEQSSKYHLPIMGIKVKKPVTTDSYFKASDLTVYKYWRKLLPRTVKGLEKTDNMTAYTALDGSMVIVPDNIQPISSDFEILQDFDFDYDFTSPSLVSLTPKGADSSGVLLVDVKVKGVLKKMKLTHLDLPFPALSYTRNFWCIKAKFGDDGSVLGDLTYISNPDSPILPYTETDSEIYFMQIVCPKPRSGRAPDKRYIHTYKYWKKALAVKETGVSVDGTTVHKWVDDLLIVPNAMKVHHCNVKFLNDFDFDFSVENDRIYMHPRGLDSIVNDLNVPVEIEGEKMWAKVRYWQVGNVNFDIDANEYHWLVSAYVKPNENDTANGMVTQTNGNGKALRSSLLSVSHSTIPLMQIRAKKPLPGQQFDLNHVFIYKYWKNAVVPAEERIKTNNEGLVIPEPDNDTIFKTILAEKEKYFVPSALITHQADFRILEDFELDISLETTYSTGLPYLRVAPKGGARNLEVMVGGVKKYMSLAVEGVQITSLFGSDYAVGWKHFVLMAQIHDDETTVKPLGTEYYSDGKPMYLKPYIDSSKFRFVQIRFKLGAGNTLDQKNIVVWKYWKKALAPLKEQLQNLGVVIP